MGGGRYLDRMERREGRSAIAARITMRDTGLLDERPDMDDLTSFTSTCATLTDEARAFINGGLGPKRDRSDPSYLRPLRVDPGRAIAYPQMAKKWSFDIDNALCMIRPHSSGPPRPKQG